MADITIAMDIVIMYVTFLGQVSHSGDQLLWDGVHRHSSCININKNLYWIWYVALVEKDTYNHKFHDLQEKGYYFLVKIFLKN